MADADVLRRLWRYKSDVEENPDEEKLIEILGKLKQISVTVAALQETGMGKVLNRLSKREGFVGVMAAKVVKHWKSTVSKEVDNTGTVHPTPSPGSLPDCKSRETDSGSESESSSWKSYTEADSVKTKGPLLHKPHNRELEMQPFHEKHHSIKAADKVSSSSYRSHLIKEESDASRKAHTNSSQKSRTQEDQKNRSSHRSTTQKSADDYHSSGKGKDKHHKHHSSSKDRSKVSQPDNRHSSMKKDSISDHSFSQHKPDSEKSFEEELTDSDEALGEENTAALDIEDYFKKTLDHSMNASNSRPEKSNRHASSNRESQKNSARDLSIPRSGGDSGYKSQHRESRISSSKDRTWHIGEAKPKISNSHPGKERQKDSRHSSKRPSSNSGLSHSKISTNHSSSHVSDGKMVTKNGSSLHAIERENSSSEKSKADHKRVERKRTQHNMSDSEEEILVSYTKRCKEDSSRGKEKHKSNKELTQSTSITPNPSLMLESPKRGHSISPRHDSHPYYQHTYYDHPEDELSYIEPPNSSLKEEKTNRDHKYHGDVLSVKAETKPNCVQPYASEDELLDLEEELYSPKHISVKKEKHWSPTTAQNRPRYSPTPISRNQRIKLEASDVDSHSVGSLSPSSVPAQPLHLNSEKEGTQRYLPEKLVKSVKQESLPSATSSREATPSYNPTPIKKEQSPLPKPAQVSSKFISERKHDSKSRPHYGDKAKKRSPSTHIKEEPFASYAQSSSDEHSTSGHSSRTKSKGKSLKPANLLHSPNSSPSSSISRSPDSHRHFSSVFDSLDSGHESSQDGSVLSTENCRQEKNLVSPVAPRSLSASPVPIKSDQDDLTDSDLSHNAQSYEPTPLSKHSTSSRDHYANLSSPHTDDGNNENDKYMPFSLSKRIKEEHYSPTPKSESSKHHLNEKKSTKSSTSSHSNSHKDYHSSSKPSHSHSGKSDKSSVKHKAESSKDRHLSSKRHYSSSSKGASGSISQVPSSSTKPLGSSHHDRQRFLSSSTRNSPAAQSDISLVSSSSYPGVKSKSSSTSSSKHHSSQRHNCSSSHSKSHYSSSFKDEKMKDSHQTSSPRPDRVRSLNDANGSSKQTESKPSGHKSRPISSSNSVPSSSDNAKSKTGSVTQQKPSSHKKPKASKRKAEEPDIDLFSDTISLKKADLNLKPKPRAKSVHPSASKNSRVSHSESSPELRPTSVSPTPVAMQKSKSAFSSVSKSSRKWESDSPSPSPSPSVSPTPQQPNANSTNRHKSSSIRPQLEDALFNTGTDSDEEPGKDEDLSTQSPKKHNVYRNEKEEAQMSFEDFMNADPTLSSNRGKHPAKSATRSKKFCQRSSNISLTSGKSTSSSSASPQRVSSSRGTSSRSSVAEDFYVPTPSKKVKVTELDILSSLPETQALYRPLPPRSGLGEEDDKDEGSLQGNLEDIGLRKLTRTHMYSGRRQGVTEVKPLFDLCMQLLVENIDALDCVGGVPYDVLKPVLERCTAQQLYHLEDYNPHFLEDTDELWEKLCQRDFRGSKPEELELWREMYLRKHNERELKYQKLKETMSSNIVKGQAGRKAQLAFVDTPIKAPRDVLRRQMKYGTGCVKMNKGPGAAGIKPYKPSIMAPVYNPMIDRQRVIKPVAPMMARAIQMRKNLRR